MSNNDVKIEVRIIHPTEGTIIKSYDADSLSKEITKFNSQAQVSSLLDVPFSADIPTILKGVVCAAKCKSKAGFIACVARCMLTGEACDGGVDNCS